METSTKFTIKQVEEFVNPNMSLSFELDTDTANQWNHELEQLRYNNNYESKFQKTDHYWGKTHWRTIAKDLHKKIS